MLPLTTTPQDDRSLGPRNGQYSPQRYDSGHGKDANGPRFSSAPSPTRPVPTPTYSGQQNGSQNGHGAYDSSQGATDELARTLRGMAVEDDYQVHQQRNQVLQPPPHSRGPHPMPQPRPYNGYPQPDYNAYYLAHAPEPYIDYQYGYSHSDPSLYASPGMNAASSASLYPGVAPQVPHPGNVPDMHRTQPGIFFDYGGAQPASQYYYPTHQAVMYAPPTPMITPQTPATLADKKRELQVRFHT